MMIIDFLQAFGRDFAYGFFANVPGNFFASTLLLVVGVVLVGVVKNLICGR